ncbi:AT-rich interactive domain-containing protein 4B, partial [Asbolus verrucosus]
QADDPPYLSVGTAVSAKYKGAFCEAKVSKVVRIVKCKVTYKMGLGTASVSDEQIKGTLRVGHQVQALHPEKKEFVEATIGKIQDCSQYTVVFDDGDITTLRRSALCLKSGRHFNESETLDQLPLTHPEHFGNPVVGGRRGRRNRQLKEDSSDGEAEEENEPDLEGYSTDIGRVVSVEATDKKRGKDNWFPGLVVIPSAQPTVRINVKDEYLVSYTVPKKEVSEFNREVGEKVESSVLAEAVNKALNYLDHNELPVHWERNSLFNMQSIDSDSEENYSDSSDDEPNEEKDRFVAQLYKFMDDSGTPLNKSPMIGNKDVDLHKLFRVVHKSGGYNRVTNQNKWRSITTRLKLPNNQITYNQVKSVYKKCLLSYESFYKTLGVTMLNHNMSTKKNRGRSLIRDKDRATPVNSPKPEKEDEPIEKKDEEKSSLDEKTKKKMDIKKEDDKKRKEVVENSDTSSSDATDQSESVPSTSKDTGRPRRLDKSKDKKPKTVVANEKAKVVENTKKDEEEKQIQQTRSKSQAPKLKEMVINLNQKKDVKSMENAAKSTPNKVAKKSEEEKKRGRKKNTTEEKASVEIITDSFSGQTISVGDKLKVYYGPTHEYKVTYEAKVIEIDRDSTGPVYLVHYTGWNTRYDEWITPNRIAENLSASTKAKRLKQSATPTSSPQASKQASASKAAAGKRGRGMSITGRSTTTEMPRSTTPSSVTSSSSRTKSPATPATRSSSRITRLDYGRKTRRASAQTDVSNHSESDSEISESESELTRTRSGNKPEDVEIKTYKKKNSRTPTVAKSEKVKEKEDVDTEKDEESDRPKRTRKFKKSPEKSTEESDDDTGSNPPKGRDFDLNQIRSELKGFNKAVKVPSLETAEKETLSSSDDSNTQIISKPEQIEEKKESKQVETSPTSEDIYEFKEPEPFEFESRTKMVDDKTSKKRIPRLYEDLEKSPKKKTIKSPGKSDKDSPELEKKRFRRTPVQKQDESEEDEKKEDPFDKLVESPSFNLKPMDKIADNKQKVVRSILDEQLDVFRTLPENDDYCRDIDLSDSESQTQPIFSRGELFSDTFSKYSPDRNTLDLEFSNKGDDLKKENEDLELIRESITRAIERTPTSDECDNLSDDDDELHYQDKKQELNVTPTLLKSNTPEIPSQEPVEIKIEVKEEISVKSPVLQISPALQETDSSLLESICSQPLSISTKLDDTKDLNLKTGTKIADSLLQKFSSIKNKGELSPKPDSDSEQDVKKDELDNEVDVEDAIKPLEVTKIIKQVELKMKPCEVEVKKPATPTKCEPNSDVKKKRKILKVLNRPLIEESDSDSSDSEQLVIRSDEDSQTNSLDKPDLKESDSNTSAAPMGTTDDSQSQEEQRNFKFDTIEKLPSTKSLKEEQIENENVKEEEPDSQLHSLLLCEETIPRSPAPASEGPSVSEQRPKTKSVLEMPFASAPGSSNNKNMLLNSDHKTVNKPQPAQLVLPLVTNRDASAVLDNTPPTTPESSISNLSPRGDHEDLSPNTIENESCKSNDAELDYPRKRRNSSLNKIPLYSEDDTQMTNEPSSGKKSREESVPASCRKRRKSTRASDEIPSKRGRKPLNRSRHNSDSDDTSEHSMTGPTTNLGLPSYDRTSKSPRPSKYNFFVEFDPSLNSGQRIAVLQQKLSELRKTYAEVKAELAAVERRRKKIRRREREVF